MNINKRIFYLCFEIILIITFLFSTNYFWNNIDVEKDAQTAYAYQFYNEELKLKVNSNMGKLIPVEDNLNENITIKISNDTRRKKSYILYLKVDNNGELNKNYLKISYDNKCYYLRNLENHTIGNITYYKLSSNSINSKKEIDENYGIYLSKETPNSEQGKTLNIEFVLEEI